MNAAAAIDELQGSNFDGICRSADDHEAAVGAEAVDEFRHGFGAGRSGKNDSGAAKFLEFLGGVGGFVIDVDVGAEFFGEGGIFGAASNSRDFISEFIGELNAEMAKAADAEDGDEITGESAAVAKGVVGGDAGAEKRTGFGVGESFGEGGEGFDCSDHELLIAAVVRDAGDFEIAAIAKVAAAALEAGVVLSAMPADANALALLPGCDAGAELVDETGNFVAGNARIFEPGPEAFLGEDVTMADATGLDFDTDLIGAGRGDFAFDNLEVGAGFGDLGDFHWACGGPGGV